MNRTVNRNAATRPRRPSATTRSRQPLKPRQHGRGPLIIMLCFCLAMTSLLIINRERVATYINRPVTKVRMENPWNRVSASEVRSLLATYMGQGFFDFDVDGVQQSLEAHPWVEQASVQRLWPDSLSIYLEEEVPIARWGDKGVLNQRAEVFVPAEVESLANLPQLIGPEGSQLKVMQQYQAVNEQLFPAGLRLTTLELSSRGSWNITINEQFEIAVGRTQVIDRLQRFLRFYESQPTIQSAAIESADLRYNNGVAIAFKTEEPTAVAVN